MRSGKHKDQEIRTVTIIGAGTMGGGIAQRFAQEGLKVFLADNKDQAVDKAEKEIKKSLDEAVAKGLFTQAEADKAFSNMTFTLEPEVFSETDLVIEAIFEDLEVKSEVFRFLDKACDKKTIFASNTSSLSIGMLSKVVSDPSRFIGLHFFYPPARNRLVELVSLPSTAKDTFNRVWSLCRRAGLVPIRVEDSPGFAVNRIFVPWLNEATRLIDDFIADVPTIETAAKEAFGIGLGPFELMNATGIPIAYHSTQSLEALGPYYGPSTILRRQVLLQKPWDIKGRPDHDRLDKVRLRLYGVVFHEACCLLDEGVASLEDIERGARIGLRWPKGPFALMNFLGFVEVSKILKGFYDRHTYLQMPKVLKGWLSVGMPWTFRYVDLLRDGPVAHIIVNRPESMNAINGEVLSQLESSFDHADKDKAVKTIVLEGVGKAFLAGADIDFFIEHIEKKRIDEIVELTRRAHRLAKRIELSKKLIIAKIDGVALGGGAELALVADVLVASERARFGFPETGIGLYPALGGTQRLPRIVGKELAKYLIMTGRRLDGPSAKKLGLVQYVVPSKDIDDFVKELALKKTVKRLGPRSGPMSVELKNISRVFSDANVKKMLSGRALSANARAKELSSEVLTKAPSALKLSNKLIDEGFELDLDKGLELELEHLPEIFSTRDALIGLKSVGKARPSFTGK
jgi:enoyl-CoA hydratase / 3-hydroxyacyl-CoA dehydrogenase